MGGTFEERRTIPISQGSVRKVAYEAPVILRLWETESV